MVGRDLHQMHIVYYSVKSAKWKHTLVILHILAKDMYFYYPPTINFPGFTTNDKIKSKRGSLGTLAGSQNRIK